MASNNVKEALYKFCESFAQKRITGIRDNIKDIRESLDSEDKNSSGDKHETGRAMLQLEQEKLGQQLSEAEKMQDILAKVNFKTINTVVSSGSLVRTSKSNYFLAISGGEFKDENQSIYCISIATPMGQLLHGKGVGDVVSFNGEEIKILEIA